MCFVFGKMSRITLYLKMRVYHMIIHVFGEVQGSYLSYSKILASETVSLRSISKESARLKQTSMSLGSNVTRKTQRALPFVLLRLIQLNVASSRFVASEHCSCVIFCFDIHS